MKESRQGILQLHQKGFHVYFCISEAKPKRQLIKLMDLTSGGQKKAISSRYVFVRLCLGNDKILLCYFVRTAMTTYVI